VRRTLVVYHPTDFVRMRHVFDFRLLVLKLLDRAVRRIRDAGARLLAYIICEITEFDECARLGLLVTVARLDESSRQPFARDKGASSCDNPFLRWAVEGDPATSFTVLHDGLGRTILTPCALGATTESLGHCSR
jgi:hypothetical protein